jgi:hypothetical protein
VARAIPSLRHSPRNANHRTPMPGVSLVRNRNAQVPGYRKPSTIAMPISRSTLPKYRFQKTPGKRTTYGQRLPAISTIAASWSARKPSWVMSHGIHPKSDAIWAITGEWRKTPMPSIELAAPTHGSARFTFQAAYRSVPGVHWGITVSSQASKMTASISAAASHSRCRVASASINAGRGCRSITLRTPATRRLGPAQPRVSIRRASRSPAARSGSNQRAGSPARRTAGRSPSRSSIERPSPG